MPSALHELLKWIIFASFSSWNTKDAESEIDGPTFCS